MFSGITHFQQYAWGYFAFKRLPQCGDDMFALGQKNLRFDGFLGRKPRLSRQGLDCWLFFCAAFTSYYEESDRG